MAGGTIGHKANNADPFQAASRVESARSSTEADEHDVLYTLTLSSQGD
jgi:hypothetical protein